MKVILDKKNVLVAGGAGFIGSHLIEALLKQYNVICVDNFITGHESNVDSFLQYPNFEFIKHDLIEPLDLNKFSELEKFQVKFQGVQEIYNLACPTSPKNFISIPVETALANSHATKNLLDLAKKYQAKFLHASSSAVYGDPLSDMLINETYWGFVDFLGPRSCYNEGKRFAETLVKFYGEKFKVETKIARIFNTYGPRMKLEDGRMIPDFVYHALKGKDVVVYGGEDDISSFCYVKDTVEGLIKLMNAEVRGAFNIGSSDGYLIKEVAQKIVELSGSRSQIIFQERLPYLTKQSLPDISNIKEKIGWFPLVSLEEGLKLTIEYMKASHGVGFSKD